MEFATESIGTNCLGILTPLKFELDWLTTPMVVVDPDVVLTLPFIDPVMVLKLVGFVISPMPGLGDVMDNMCRSSSSSTESSAFRPVLRAIIVRRHCSVCDLIGLILCK